MTKIVYSLIILLSISVTKAETPNLDSLSQSDVDNISKEFAANFVHTTVTPADSLGSIFGFQIGIIAGATESKTLEKLSKEQDPNADVGAIPHAGLIGVVSIPFGITGELSMIPEKSASGVTIKNTSFAIKWTMTDNLLSFLPFDMAVRAHASSNEFSFEDTINNSSTGNTDVSSKISFETSSKGLNFSISKDLFIITPYAGIGYVSTETDINLTATSGTIFDFTTAQSSSSKNSGAHIFMGAQLNLLVLSIGAEYSKIIDISKYTVKFALGF